MLRQPVPLDDAELARRYAAGETLAALASTYRVSASTIRKHLAKMGCRMRRRGRNWQPTQHPGDERLRELYVDRELTARAMAELLGVTPATVAKWLHRAGIARDWSMTRRGYASPRRRAG